MQHSTTQTTPVTTSHISHPFAKAEALYLSAKAARHQTHRETGKFPPLRLSPCICEHPTKAGYCVVTVAVAKAENLMVHTR